MRAGVDAERGIGFAYGSNQMGGDGDAQARSLTEALVGAIGG
jgi:hypothetical protein